MYKAHIGVSTSRLTTHHKNRLYTPHNDYASFAVLRSKTHYLDSINTFMYTYANGGIGQEATNGEWKK